MCVSAAHVLTWEWIGKPDGRISCQDEGWVTYDSHITSYLLHSVVLQFPFSLSYFGYFRPCWLCTAVCWWPVWGKIHKYKHTDSLQTHPLHPLHHTSMFLAPLGPNALRAATLEATRPHGSQQQTDMGQWRVHLSASRHRTAVNQGNEISFKGSGWCCSYFFQTNNVWLTWSTYLTCLWHSAGGLC